MRADEDLGRHDGTHHRAARRHHRAMKSGHKGKGHNAKIRAAKQLRTRRGSR